jgi:ubiquinone/menaquinone biosynthesis C-methylase UbiE
VDSSQSQIFASMSFPEANERFTLRQLFEPWARELVQRAELQPGWSVLDVATGLAPVARLAAAAVGPGGRVVASDISAPMLTRAAARPRADGWATTEFLQSRAEAIDASDDNFDAVFCQYGLQYFDDRASAIGEMRRVVRPGGVVVVSTWAAERPLGLFGPMAETLAELGLPEPFARAFDPAIDCLSAAELKELLRTAGFRDVHVEMAELDARWDSGEVAASAVLATAFGPMVSALPGDIQSAVRARLLTKLGGSERCVIVRTVSNIASGVK